MKEQNESIARYMGWTTEKSKGFDWWHNPQGQRVGTKCPDYSTDHQAMAEVMEKLINTKNVYEVRTTTQISCEVVIEMVNDLIYKSVGPTEIAAKFAAVVQFLKNETMKNFETLKDCISQLEKCEFKDPIGHPIENNVAFIQLKELSEVNNLRMPIDVKSCETCADSENCTLIESCKGRGYSYCRYFKKKGTN